MTTERRSAVLGRKVHEAVVRNETHTKKMLRAEPLELVGARRHADFGLRRLRRCDFGFGFGLHRLTACPARLVRPE
jgi:hypothetical protein